MEANDLSLFVIFFLSKFLTHEEDSRRKIYLFWRNLSICTNKPSVNVKELVHYTKGSNTSWQAQYNCAHLCYNTSRCSKIGDCECSSPFLTFLTQGWASYGWVFLNKSLFLVNKKISVIWNNFLLMILLLRMGHDIGIHEK